MGSPPISADRIRLLRKALGQFDRLPYTRAMAKLEGPSPLPGWGSISAADEVPVFSGISDAIADRMQSFNARGMFSQNLTHGLQAPVDLHTRAFATYPAGDRATRRHELMHGIQAAASQDSSLRQAVPWWARGAPPASFRNELVSRLASGGAGQLRDWPLRKYAELPYTKERWLYYAAAPVQDAANAAREFPVGAALVGAAGGAAGLGSAIYAADMLYGDGKEGKKPIVPEYDPLRGRAILEKLSSQGYR